MKLNRLGFRKVDVDQNDILHKKEMKEILGGDGYCALFEGGNYYLGSGACATSNCYKDCSDVYNSLGIQCVCW